MIVIIVVEDLRNKVFSSTIMNTTKIILLVLSFHMECRIAMIELIYICCSKVTYT